MAELLRATEHRTQAIVAIAIQGAAASPQVGEATLIAAVQCWWYSSGDVLEDTVATALVRHATAGRAAQREHLGIGRG
jgi:hypothetical protein